MGSSLKLKWREEKNPVKGEMAMRCLRKSITTFGACCVLGILMLPAFGQNTSDGGRPSITVEFENELVTLAKGYEEAFKKLPAGPKFAVVKTPDGPVYLDDSIRELEAAGV